jgi:hypothetical protein
MYVHHGSVGEIEVALDRGCRDAFDGDVRRRAAECLVRPRVPVHADIRSRQDAVTGDDRQPERQLKVREAARILVVDFHRPRLPAVPHRAPEAEDHIDALLPVEELALAPAEFQLGPRGVGFQLS